MNCEALVHTFKKPKLMYKKIYKSAFLLLTLGFSNLAMSQNGGETCGTATLISSIPYTANGFTTGMTNTYSTVCPSSSNNGNSRDVVYRYNTGASTEYVTISLCQGTTNFDAQLYVYQSTCNGTPVGCSEDQCDNAPTYTNAFLPRITNLTLNPSTSYYIVVDGYSNTTSGNFTINISAGTPPPPAIIQFTDMTSLLPTTTFHSGNAVGVVDMNGDGYDDIVRAANNATMYIEYQNTSGGTFTETSYTNNIGSPWGMCVGDVNNDGMNDVLWGDNGSATVLTRNGATYTTTDISVATGAGYLFTQGSNFHDVDGDGFIDAFVCHDVGMSHIYKNNAGSSWTFNQALIPMATSPVSDNSGNYASIWTDINNDNKMDLYITHCRQAISNPLDARRINQIFLNNGNNTYTQDVANTSNLRIGAQSWSSDFGDLDNDGDMDAFVLNYDVESQFLENNGSGVFTNIIAGSGISGTNTFFGMNVIFEDFNNDTYQDILITGDNEHRLYINNGDMTFTLDLNDFIYNNYVILSQGTGDLNHDGHVDIFASYADVYNSPSSRNDKLWMNDGVDGNNFVTFQCEGTTSNINGIGAILKLYGPWGVQIREVRSGEAYGVMNTLDCHFGLGTATGVDSLHVIWPSGIEDMFYNPDINVFVPIIEGSSSNIASVTATSSDPNKSICQGESVTFTALPGNGGTTPAYQWKINGGNVGTNSTTFTSTTLVNGDVITCVMTSNLPGVQNNPATSTAITMTVNTIPATPTISQVGSVLTSSSATGNQWYLDGNLLAGEVNQDITVVTNGVYTVVVTANGCSSPSSTGTTTTVGINEAENPYLLAVFPNPNDGRFNITFKAEKADNYTLELHNAIGEVVISKNITNHSGTYQLPIVLDEIASGMYTIVLTNGSKEVFKKVIVY